MSDQPETTGDQPEGQPPEGDPTPEPEGAGEPDQFPREYVEELRQENAKWRSKLRDLETNHQSTTDTLSKIAKQLGIEQEEPDVAEVQRQLEQRDRELSGLKVSNAVQEAARTHKADVDLLVPYLKGQGKLDGIDPDDTDAISRIVAESVESNPKLRAQTPGGSADGGAGRTSDPKPQTMTDMIRRQAGVG